MKKLTSTQWSVVILAILTISIGIVTNFATNTVPAWLVKYSWLPWTLLFILGIAFVLVSAFHPPQKSNDLENNEKEIPVPIFPYIVGPPIEDPNHFFGRSKEVDNFYSHINSPQPQSLQVLGIRRSGKTSYLRYISHPDVVQKKALNPAKTFFIYVNLQDDVKTIADFYNAIYKGIQHYCHSNAINLAIPSDSFKTRQAFIKWLNSEKVINYGLIVLLDEFETFCKKPAFDSDFFKGLRALVSMRLAWITASYRDLYRLSRVLGENDKTSLFFNVFHPTPIMMGGLSPVDIEDLIQKPANQHGIKYSIDELIKIEDLAGPLPFFVQAAAGHWFSIKQQDKNLDLSTTEATVRQRLAKDMNRYFDAYWQQFDDNERNLLSFITKNKTITKSYMQSHNAILTSLFDYGLIIQQGSNYNIACSIFADWIRSVNK